MTKALLKINSHLFMRTIFLLNDNLKSKKLLLMQFFSLVNLLNLNYFCLIGMVYQFERDDRDMVTCIWTEVYSLSSIKYS